ncbi:MAG: hypothetical protein ACOY82_08225 [Pseudomonadota bacterium]
MNAVPWDSLQREVLEAMGFSVYSATSATVAIATTTTPVVSSDVVSDDPLVAALLRAAGRSRDARDAAQLAQGWPSPQTLRRDPRAKQALWPQLRALRRPRT